MTIFGSTNHTPKQMPIPTYDTMLHPLLDLATREAITRKQAQGAIAAHFRLTESDQSERLPSGGSTVLANRTSWAMTFLTKGKLIEKVAPKTYRATQSGIQFLSEHGAGFGLKDLEAMDGWKEAWQSTPSREGESETSNPSATPGETIDAAVATLHSDVRGRLMEAILSQSPAFFERLVLDVLLKMGYGGSREDAAEHLGQSGDEGIDGRINQDALGLDQILVQAKRYAVDRPIDRKTIQAFIGSLAGQGVSKGIFITTSTFAETAREFVQRGSQTKIVLIDGQALMDLMLRHKVGIRVERTIEILNIDQNYFEEGE